MSLVCSSLPYSQEESSSSEASQTWERVLAILTLLLCDSEPVPNLSEPVPTCECQMMICM